MLATKVHNTMHDGPGGSGQLAEERGLPMARIAMAWVLSKPVVTAPIVGATKPHHLAEAAAALEIQLTDDETHRLEEPYTTQPAYWW